MYVHCRTRRKDTVSILGGSDPFFQPSSVRTHEPKPASPSQDRGPQEQPSAHMPLKDAYLIVVCSHAQGMYGTDVCEYFVDKTVLDVDALGVASG